MRTPPISFVAVLANLMIGGGLLGGCDSNLHSVAYFDPPASNAPLTYTQSRQNAGYGPNYNGDAYAYDAAQPFTMRLTSDTIKYWRAGPTTVVSVWRGAMINQPGAMFVATMAPPINNHAAQAAYLEIPSSVANSYSGRALTITVTAKQAANGSTDSFAVNYTTADGESTGWVKFTPAGRYQDYSVSFQKPPSVSASPDYVSIWADTEATGRSLIVSEVTVSSEAIDDSQEPRLVVANMEPALGGQISASNRSNGLTYDLAQAEAMGPLGYESGSIVAIDGSRIPPLQGVSDFGGSLPGANMLERSEIIMPSTPLGSTRSAAEGLRPNMVRSTSDSSPVIFGQQPEAVSQQATDAATGQLGYLDTLGNFIPLTQAEQELLAVSGGNAGGSNANMLGPDARSNAPQFNNFEMEELEGVKLTELPDGLNSGDLRPDSEDIGQMGTKSAQNGPEQEETSQGEGQTAPDLGSLKDILALGFGAETANMPHTDSGQGTGQQTPPFDRRLSGLSGSSSILDFQPENPERPSMGGAPAKGLTDSDLMLMVGPMPAEKSTAEPTNIGENMGGGALQSPKQSANRDNSQGQTQRQSLPLPRQTPLEEALKAQPADKVAQILETLQREDNVSVPIVENLPQAWAWGAHLASYPDPGLAEIGWSVLERTYDGFSYFEPHIQRVVLYDGNWIMYRLFAGPLESEATSEAFCASVAQEWEYCVPRKLAN